MASPVIQVEKLGKRYRIGIRRERYATLRDTLARWATNPRGRFGKRSRTPTADPDTAEDTIWALRDVSFDVQRGEVLGIIGRNGAGKSTLLKVLSRITEPTEGHADIRGRVASLLEVGTGFHSELTGRENVYLNGAILGMKRAEIDRKFDEIVAFAEVERFIDTPVKYYSSGMYMRLAFSVAASLDPQILVIDEVLAVGDAQFQQKCLGKMSDVAHSGRTVLFVSHNMAAVQRLCGRGLLLADGQIAALGPVSDVVTRYLASAESTALTSEFNPRTRSGTGWARVVDLRLLDERGRTVDALPCDADLRLEVDVAVCRPDSDGTSLRGLVLELVLCSALGQPLVSLMNVDDTGGELPAAATCRMQVRLPGPTFIPGRYSVNVFLGIPFLQHVDEVVEAKRFDLLPPRQPWRPYEFDQNQGVLCRRAEWRRVDSSSQARVSTGAV